MTANGDLFTSIHKAMRSMIYNLSGRLQTHDFADVPATQSLVTDLENDFATARSAGRVLCVLSQHAVDEESVIFPSVAKFGNGLVTQLIEDHHDLTRRELAIAKSGHEILAMDSAEGRVAAGVRLNQAANELFGAYIVHMNREEAELVPLMGQHFTDEQQVAMRAKIMGAMPPDRMFAILGYMLPSLNATELAGILSSFRQGMPPPVLKAVTDLCAARVDPARWNVVKLRVGL